MRINLFPTSALPGDETRLTLIKTAGNHLSINGEVFNFNSMNPGDYIEAGLIPSEWIFGRVEHVDGHVTLTVRYPIGMEPETFQCFPEPIIVDDDGPIDIPVDTVINIETVPVKGGVNIVTTRNVWHQKPVVTTEFIPDPVETDNVDA